MKKSGFTMTELIVVVILIAIIAGFALPNYSRAVQKSHEGDIAFKLRTIHATNVITRARTGSFVTGTTLDVTGINSQLNLAIVPNGEAYSYTFPPAIGTTYTTATYAGTGMSFVAELRTDGTVCCACASTCRMLDQCAGC